MAYENNDKKMESIYSKRIRAGKRRTYFFDVRATRGNDYYLTITESRKRFDDNGYDRHKIFLYKEDFNKFIKALGEAVDYVKTELMPDFDVRAGHPARVIVEYAKEREADLIVMGTHGRTGLRRMLMGSVAEMVMRRARCPVLTVKDSTVVDEIDRREDAVVTV